MRQSQIEITYGPTKQDLINAFTERQPVTVRLRNGQNKLLMISQLQLGDGSESSFNFVTAVKKASGYYDTTKQKGFIIFPAL